MIISSFYSLTGSRTLNVSTKWPGTCHLSQASLELVFLSSQALKNWDCRYVSLQLPSTSYNFCSQGNNRNEIHNPLSEL